MPSVSVVTVSWSAGCTQIVFISERASSSIGVIEDDGDYGFGDSCLALFVDKFLKIGSPNLLQVGDFEDEANGIKNVGFSKAVQAGDGVEEEVEARNAGLGGVGFEPFQANLLNVHLDE
ncbi:hypothetical protein RJT34_29941 [Clitoria ternatea]|uniref:Uncharacterized protein n=1 Tax=Clitoria ternatea TaxID=43366 RepID=A0AAN9I1K0_CLITE